jgi:hypothetical protein
MAIEVTTVDQMPTKGRSGELTEALRGLRPGQAIFIPARNGERGDAVQRRVGSTARKYAAHTRIDHQRGGCWVYK